MSVATKQKSPFFRSWRCAIIGILLFCATSIVSSPAFGDEMGSDSPQAILHELKSFREMGSVLYVAAHPDDENTELITYLSRGRNYRTAYLSLTRGDGGQNVLSGDLGYKLGLARTQELIAARQIDGGRQFFSRAIDFGFSKNYQETMSVWNKQEVLSDVVRVIRQFRPDVMVARFSPSPGGTHGHHTSATLLAIEAFKLAGDAKAFPEQKLEPWQPKRLFWNVSTWQKDKIASTDVLKIDIGGKDSVTGETFHKIASASRAMHKTQGFDSFKLPGGEGEQRTESFQILEGEPAKTDIMDGVNTNWNRISGGDEIGKEIDGIIEKFDVKAPEKSATALLRLREKLSALPEKSSIITEKLLQLDGILQACLGLRTQTTVTNADIVPGEMMKLNLSAEVHLRSPVSVNWKAVRYPLLKNEISGKNFKLLAKNHTKLQINEPSSFESNERLPETTPLTQPYWLKETGTAGMFQVSDPDLIGTPENAPSFPVEYVFDVDGQTLIVQDEPVSISTDSAGNETKRRLNVIPPVSLSFINETLIMTPGTSRSAEVELKSSRANAEGTIRLGAPDGWKVEPANQAFKLAAIGEVARFTFTLTSPAKPGSAEITADAELNGVHYTSQRQEISYPHIPPQLVQPPAMVKAVCLDLSKKGQTIGYLPGAGDSLAENLQQMGYAVKILDDANLTASDLEGLDAVVVGVRAFNVREKIGNAMPLLFAYVENGGVVVVQYNRPDKLKVEKVAPYELKISSDRVTNENAEMTFLAPDNPVLNTPNKITSADFDGWVQERGLYFPNQWDAKFTPILSCSDTGEQPVKGALLVAKYGKGYYIYTGLGFFRQLPAGVPGAYRLFANMVSIGGNGDEQHDRLGIK
jgi:Uncharacterized proteins, LmbE homologs